MIARLAGLVANPWKAAALALLACAVAGWGAAGIQTLRASGLRASLAAEKEARATDARLAAEAALRASQAAREAEARHAVEQGKIVSELAKTKEAADNALSAARADADGLRVAVACYAAGDCAGANAASSAGGDCRDRTRTLGILFRKADSLAEELARDAERRNREVRALKQQVEADRNACGEWNAGHQD